LTFDRTLLAAKLAARDFPAEQPAHAGADDGPNRSRSAARNFVTQQPAKRGPDDQACGAVRAPAIVSAIRASIDAIVIAEPPGPVVASVSVIAVRIIAAEAMIGAIIIVATIFVPIAAIVMFRRCAPIPFRSVLAVIMPLPTIGGLPMVAPFTLLPPLMPTAMAATTVIMSVATVVISMVVAMFRIPMVIATALM
jgi:hypothetical protein